MSRPKTGHENTTPSRDGRIEAGPIIGTLVVVLLMIFGAAFYNGFQKGLADCRHATETAATDSSC